MRQADIDNWLMRFGRLGAHWRNGLGTEFRLWAPQAESVDLELNSGRRVRLEREAHGYHSIVLTDVGPGIRYGFREPRGALRPDPASRFQPDGVHGMSEVLEGDFAWTDSQWRGRELQDLVIYEIHTGTFSVEGTFEGIQRCLSYLKKLGVTAIEIMPVAQFPGARNWGYDGVGLFAVQNSYGGPRSLKSLVNACHDHGLAVILDVVYNHLGPEGNYLSLFGPYFQDRYKTPWGQAVNFDGPGSDEVRRYFLQNARQWFEEFHFDGLRLDAVHAIFDMSARPFLEEMGILKRELESRLGRRLHLIAESDTNDARVLLPSKKGGLGLDAQWADDFHHCLHSLLSGERQGYYADYGSLEQLAAVYRQGVLYSGEYSEFRGRSHGRPYNGLSRARLVVCAQNHDQIGNRMKGDRLTTLVPPEKQKLAAACLFLSPFLPLLFMGEEYGETKPFPYFIDHSDSELIEAVRKGRREEFSGFLWSGEPPDPAAVETFQSAILEVESNAMSADQLARLELYSHLISISKWIRQKRVLEAERVEASVVADGKVLRLAGRADDGERFLAYFSFSDQVEKVPLAPEDTGLEIVLGSWDDEPVHFRHQDNQDQRRVSGGVVVSPESTDLTLKPYTALAMRGR